MNTEHSFAKVMRALQARGRFSFERSFEFSVEVWKLAKPFCGWTNQGTKKRQLLDNDKIALSRN